MPGIGLSEFCDRLNDIMPVMFREYIKHRVNECHKIKITLPQFIVLNMLNMHGELRMTDLASFMNVTTAAMTGIVDRLVREGYVARVSDPEDRRIIKVKLTAKGASVVKSVKEEEKKVTMKMFGIISQKEREEYLKILTHIRDHIIEERH